jgi:hypothetical protein
MKNIIKKAEEVCIEAKNYLLEHLDDFEFCNVREHTVDYLLKVGEQEYEIRIWTSNGKDCVKFYDSLYNMKLDLIEYTPEEQEKLWNKVQNDINQEGEKRNITMSRLSNDLFFQFKGVFGQVRFSGYDDNGWWTKYKPTEIKETEEIIWQLDLDKMIATYKKSS